MAAPLSLTSGWFIAPGREAETIAALRRLAWEVQANEPDTLMYLVHVPFSADQPAIESLPPPTPNSVVFIEEYRTPEAFPQHVKGPVFRTFVEKNGSLFVNSDGKPFTTVPFLTRIAGFIRRGAGASPWFRPRHRPSHHYPRIPNAPTRSVGLIGKFQISLAN